MAVKTRFALVLILLGVVAIGMPRMSVQAQGTGGNGVCDPTVGGCTLGPALYGTELRALYAQMAANPSPAVVRVPVDEKKLYSRAYRRVLKETDIFNAPRGQKIGKIDAGFNFVNAGQEKDGYVEIRAGQWVTADVLGPVNKAVSKFSGVTFEGLPTLSFGWILLDTKPSKAPGAKPITGTADMKRYTLVNIYAAVDVDSWLWYLIGPDQWVIQTRLARLNPVQRPAEIAADARWVAVDTYEQTLIAYEGSKAVYATLVSTGLDKWPTDNGVYQIAERYDLIKMSGAERQPDFYFLPEVPYVMYFNMGEQEALHGAYWHDGFGFRRSHGCVNLSITDSQWLYNWSKDAATGVYVYASGEYRHGAPR